MPSGGTLSLSVRAVDTAEASGVVLSVEDNGVGIPAAQLPKIFDAFFTTRSSIGTGIGLFVTRQFVEGHGGRIEIVSSTDPVSHGTKATIFLPVDSSQPASSLP